MSYSKTVKLQHHESLMKVDKRTGEVSDVPSSPKGNPDMAYVNKGVSYHKNYTKAWKVLRMFTSDSEYALAHELSMLAKHGDNFLPLGDDLSYSYMAELLNMDRRKFKTLTDKLFELGVFGKWSISTVDHIRKTHWVFNPYLSFNGIVMNKTLMSMFHETLIYKLMNT